MATFWLVMAILAVGALTLFCLYMLLSGDFLSMVIAWLHLPDLFELLGNLLSLLFNGDG